METPSLSVASHRAPLSWVTPTHLFFEPSTTTATSPIWQSRRARKGRYALKTTDVHDRLFRDTYNAEWKQSFAARVRHEGCKLKPGIHFDVTWWFAFVFTLGSAVWVVNGFFVWFPILRPSLDSPSFTHTAAATAFVGASIFEVGAYLGVIEVLVRGQEINDTALETLLHNRRQVPHAKGHDPFKAAQADVGEKKVVPEARSWIFWGTPMWHDMGYLAALVQLLAATIFWVSCLTGLPGVIPGFEDGESSVAIVDVFFWTPQVIGGCGFIISSMILLIEVQNRWYQPALMDIGWHVAFWNLIGSIGFTLCGALGYSTASGAVYQSSLSTWWGSWAFLIGSFLQLWEASMREEPS